MWSQILPHTLLNSPTRSKISRVSLKCQRWSPRMSCTLQECSVSAHKCKHSGMVCTVLALEKRRIQVKFSPPSGRFAWFRLATGLRSPGDWALTSPRFFRFVPIIFPPPGIPVCIRVTLYPLASHGTFPPQGHIHSHTLACLACCRNVFLALFVVYTHLSSGHETYTLVQPWSLAAPADLELLSGDQGRHA